MTITGIILNQMECTIGLPIVDDIILSRKFNFDKYEVLVRTATSQARNTYISIMT